MNLCGEKGSFFWDTRTENDVSIVASHPLENQDDGKEWVKKGGKSGEGEL